MWGLPLSVSFHHPLQDLLVSLQILHWYLGLHAPPTLITFAWCLCCLLTTSPRQRTAFTTADRTHTHKQVEVIWMNETNHMQFVVHQSNASSYDHIGLPVTHALDRAGSCTVGVVTTSPCVLVGRVSVPHEVSLRPRARLLLAFSSSVVVQLLVVMNTWDRHRSEIGSGTKKGF